MRCITSVLAVAALLVKMIVGAAPALASVEIDDARRFVSFSSFDSAAAAFDLGFDYGDPALKAALKVGPSRHRS